MQRRIVWALALWVITLLSARARADTGRVDVVEAPIGGKAIAIPSGRVVCGTTAGDWTIDADTHFVKPPTSETAIGRSVDVPVAASAGACGASVDRVTLVAVGTAPTINGGATIYVDEARGEVRGRHLHGALIEWKTALGTGEATCMDLHVDGTDERCSFATASGLPADPGVITLTWLPAGARAADDAMLYDLEGRRVLADRGRIGVARVVVASFLRPDVAIDAFAASATIPLRHPEAVASVDCSPGSCQVDGASIVVGAVPFSATSLTVRFSLAARVSMRKGDTIDGAPSVRVPVLRCPISVASGEPFRGLDAQRVVLKLEGRCAKEATHLRFQVDDVDAPVSRTESIGDAAYVAVRVHRLDDEEVAIAAVREDGEAFVVAHGRATTQAAPSVRALVDLPGHGPVDVIPTNSDAIVRASGGPTTGRLVVLPVDGAYTLGSHDGAVTIRGAAGAAGLVAIRIAYRSTTLPAAFADLDLVVFVDPVQRPVREVNLPAPIDASVASDRRLIELSCDPGDGRATPVAPGTVTHVPFAMRDGCRLVVHRERLGASFGTQKVDLEVDVERVDGSPRGDARLSRTLIFGAADSPRTIFLHGADGRFDRYSVRVSHVADERHYLAGDETGDGLPGMQWSVVTGQGNARIYATSAIPTGMYRVSDRDHSGILTLNFGVIGRFTWLDSLGREGLLALEGGVVAVGLANDTSASGHSLTQVSTVMGLGFGVPIANRALATETSINLHAWLEWEPSRAIGGEPGKPLGFVFGPSITIGNLGADL